LKIFDYLMNTCEDVKYIDLNNEVKDLTELTLFELENIRCTSSQHKVINFLIEIRKEFGDSYLIPSSNKDKILSMYAEALTMNSPSDKEMVL
jgi:hypothetical protein